MAGHAGDRHHQANRTQQPRPHPPRARTRRPLRRNPARPASQGRRAAGQGEPAPRKHGVCMDVKEAAVEYLPEIAPQTYEDDVPPGYKRTEVGVIPEDWGVSELGSLFKIASSKRVMQAQWRASGIPFYRTREIAALSECGRVQNDLFISEKLYREYATKYGVPEKGDILVTGIGTIGLAYVVADDENFYFKDASVIWLKNNGSYDANFLNQLYKTSVIKDQINNSSTGTTVATYTIAGAQKTLVPAPSKTEQRAIATALSDAD